MCHISSMKEEREREREEGRATAPRGLSPGGWLALSSCFSLALLPVLHVREMQHPPCAASCATGACSLRWSRVFVHGRRTAYGQHLHTASDIAICTSSSAVFQALSASNKLSALLSSLTTAPSGPSTPSPFQSAAAVVLDPATPFAHPGLMSPRLRDKWVVCRPSCTPSKLLCCSRQKPERRSAPPLASQAAAAH